MSSHLLLPYLRTVSESTGCTGSYLHLKDKQVILAFPARPPAPAEISTATHSVFAQHFTS